MYSSQTKQTYLLFATTLFVAMCLNILPLPSWAIWFRPHWVFLVMVFWLMTHPQTIGIGIAWSVGLLLDLLSGTLLGTHALMFTLSAYLLVRFHQIIRALSLLQQTIIVALLAAVYILLQFWFNQLAGLPILSASYWFTLITTVLLWPWLFLLFHPD